MAPDFLAEKQHEIAARLKELEPAVAEYRLLEAAAAALDGVRPQAASVPGAVARPAPAREAAPKRKPRAKGEVRRGRPKGTGARSAQALALVKQTPGITIPEMAASMGIKQNYLYRVLPSLAEDGFVIKDGRGWKAKDAA